MEVKKILNNAQINYYCTNTITYLWTSGIPELYRLYLQPREEEFLYFAPDQAINQQDH